MSNMKLMNHLWAELHAVSKLKIDLEMFESEKNINELNISILTEQVQKTASELWNLLADLMKSQHVISNYDTLTTYKSSMMMICFILTHDCVSIKCNNILMLLKLYLHSMRIKQQIINVLAELDIISSYQTINSKYAELTNIEKVLLLSCI